MTSEAVARPATPKQLAYIENLRGRLGISEPEVRAEELTSKKAALMISELISQDSARKGKSGSRSAGRAQSRVDQGSRIKQARLGLAFKETYRSFDKKGWSPLGPRSGQFAKAVMDLYIMFGEIEQMIEGQQG